MGKPDTTGTVDIADSVGYVVGRKGHFVAHTAEIDIHPNMGRRRGHIPAPVPHEWVRRAKPEV